MERKDILIRSALLISIVISTIPVTAQNNKEKKTISSPKIPSQLRDSKLLPEATISFPTPSTELFKPNSFSPSYNNLFYFNPVLCDYNLSDTTKWSTCLSFIPFNRQTTFLGLGEYNNIGVSLLWNFTNILSFETNAYFMKQFGYVFPFRQISYGMGLTLNGSTIQNNSKNRDWNRGRISIR